MQLAAQVLIFLKRYGVSGDDAKTREGAEQHARQFLNEFLAPTPKEKFSKAKVMLALGEIAEARRLLEEAVEEDNHVIFREELRILNEWDHSI
ncbi:MAG: hypothetical protein LW832_11070 [Parachlamydia sp.]|jgi:thioredoxin-like negative regulator of GroEL|nr:hypothetical protein [Parachlamydia sp.]